MFTTLSTSSAFYQHAFHRAWHRSMSPGYPTSTLAFAFASAEDFLSYVHDGT